ncbi:MAG: tetratricopeptide repeat protein [Synechococcales bacterium]|nr:tetratricopeptide repeat protein [Synechococcales bacterium]
MDAGSGSPNGITAEQVFQLVNQWNCNRTGSTFNDLTRQVFLLVWQDFSYRQIAEALGYEESYLRDVGSRCFQQLSQTFAIEVSKRNLKTSFYHFLSSQNSPLNHQSTVQENPTSVDAHGIEFQGVEVYPVEARSVEDRKTQNLNDPELTSPEPNSSELESPNLESADLASPAQSMDLPTHPVQSVVSASPTFLGRDREIADLNHLISQGHKILVIQGIGGMGKTTLARKYLEPPTFDVALELWMATETQNIISAENQVEEWLRVNFQMEVGGDLGINLERLRRRLRDRSERYGILIDNLDSTLDGDGQFLPNHRSYVDLLRMLSDPSLNSLTLITSRERIQEGNLSLQHYSLSGLSEDAWRDFFHCHGLPSQSPILADMCQACGGNPQAMMILKGTIAAVYEGDMDAYWRDCDRNLLSEYQVQALVAQQFDQLWSDHPTAYRLLCRLGCYRYQDLPHISREGVYALLWDEPEAQRLSAVRALQNRSLLESRRNSIFWLHAIIQAEAITRLKALNEWELAHRKAAQFWLNSSPSMQTLEDALRSLEAYYHYLEIEDFEQACEVLVMRRNSCWGDDMPLGWLFYRFGLLQPMLAAVNRIVETILPDLRVGRLYNLLGYTHRIAGEMDLALHLHQQSLNLARSQGLVQLEISALFNLGLCHRDCWELDLAHIYFQTVYDLASSSDHPIDTQYVLYAHGCLAYLAACQGDRITAISHADQVKMSALARVTTWGRGYTLLFLANTYKHLDEVEAALELYQEVLLICEAHQFAQIKGKALDGVAQVYRQMQDFARAIDCHQKSIALLESLGAKCNLAEAYAQRGITSSMLGDEKAAAHDRAQALRLFRQINTPARIRWVQHLLDV